jgi:structure-specific endonuclease subunit SLX1
MTEIDIIEKESFVYVLECTDKSTYVGATMDLDHRLRQHNKEIKGGAHATSIKVQQGKSWNRVCHIAGFPNWTAALQFEWALKHHSRKLPQKMYPLERRMRGLHTLMHLERPTSKAVPYYEYYNGTEDDNPGPKIIWESQQARYIYESIHK